MLFFHMLMGCRRRNYCLSITALFLLTGLLLAAVSQIVVAAPATPQPSAVDLLQGIESKYNRLRSVRMRFQQLYRQGRQTLRREEGTLYLSKPGQMRWEYETPEPKLFLSDGQKLLLYVPSENRMTETQLKNSGDLRTPLSLLLGQLRLQEEFDEIIQGPFDLPPLEAGNTVLKATPKHFEGRLEWVVFEINPKSEIRRIIVAEPGGMQTEFRFEQEERNIPVAASLFRFEPPSGTEIVREQGFQ